MSLQGKHIALLDTEHRVQYTQQALERAGAQVTVLMHQPRTSTLLENDGSPPNDDLNGWIDHAMRNDFDAIVMANSVTDADRERLETLVTAIMIGVSHHGRSVAAITHGNWLLIDLVPPDQSRDPSIEQLLFRPALMAALP